MSFNVFCIDTSSCLICYLKSFVCERNDAESRSFCYNGFGGLQDDHRNGQFHGVSMGTRLKKKPLNSQKILIEIL